MKKKIRAIISIMVLISLITYHVQVTKVQANPIAIGAGATIVIAGGLIAAGCYSGDHESMTNMIEYTWNHLSTEMQEEVVRLSLYKDTGVIIGKALLSAIGDAINQRFGAEESGEVTEGQMVEAGSDYVWPEHGVQSFSMVNGDVYMIDQVAARRLEIYKNGQLYTFFQINDDHKPYVECGIKLSYGKLAVRYRFENVDVWENWVECSSLPSYLAAVESGTWTWDLDENRSAKEPKRIPLPPGGIPETADDADNWAWNQTQGKTSETIDKPVTGDDVTADTAGIAGAVRSIRNLVNSIEAFCNPALQPTLNLEPLKVSVNAFTTRFPFSLPWDFLRAFTSMKTDGTWQPAFEVNLPAGLPVGDVFDFEIDLSMWQDAADLARKLELLAFDIGLILLTRKLLGGGV